MIESGPATKRRVAVILAAGKGTRMRSALPKVLHLVAGLPLLEWVISAARQGGADQILVVVGHGAEQIRKHFTGVDDLVWVEQHEQLGTGHALAQAAPYLSEAATLLVLSGDVPLLSPQTLHRLAAAAETSWGAMATAELAEPGSLGRVVAAGDQLVRIAEAADARPDELALRHVNAGIYALPAPAIFAELAQLGTANAKGEHYLTDALGAAAARGERITLVDLPDPAEALGINDRRDLARVHQVLLARHLDRLMLEGVTLLDPARTVVEPGVRVGRDTVLHPGVSLLGTTTLGADCEIHQGAWIRDSTLDDGVIVEPYSILDGARVGPDCHVGPFARLRPASVLLRGARVGNFVELKKTELGEGSKAAHLAYLGDATVGRDVNVGAGVVTCNYDGVSKHRTEIGDGAFIGSDTMLIAPVRVGRQATTAAGSTINQDVPDDALGVARQRQRNVPGWGEKRRARQSKND